jgi:hypothetical protein
VNTIIASVDVNAASVDVNAAIAAVKIICSHGGSLPDKSDWRSWKSTVTN